MYNDYPNIYYIIYPKVFNELKTFIMDKNLKIISEEQVKNFVDTIYFKIIEEFPEIHEDFDEINHNGIIYFENRYFYGRTRIMRDLILTIVISEILRFNQYNQ